MMMAPGNRISTVSKLKTLETLLDFENALKDPNLCPTIRQEDVKRHIYIYIYIYPDSNNFFIGRIYSICFRQILIVVSTR